jgi:pSer/pThr/pTyr-binding forkhead associated (FHA) protein
VRPGGVRCETLLEPLRPAAECEELPTIIGGALYPVDDALAPAARLVALDGPLRGRAFELCDRVNTIGRSRENTLPLPDPHISRFHARIDLEEHGFVLVDLGSTNGTFVRGRRVTRHPLEPGDRLQLGSTLLEFQLIEA